MKHHSVYLLLLLSCVIGGMRLDSQTLRHQSRQENGETREFYQQQHDGKGSTRDTASVDLSGFSLVGDFALKLTESDGQEWRYDIMMRDSVWRPYNIPLSAFGSDSGFLNTPVTKFTLIPIGGISWQGLGTEVVDWIDKIVIADTLIDDFEDGSYSDWMLDYAYNGSYLWRYMDARTPDGSAWCFKLVHGNVMFQTFAGFVWKNLDRVFSPSDTLRFWLRGYTYYLTDVEENPACLPNSFVLFENYPNPFNPITTINYQLPTVNHVTMKVYDMLGREVATLVNEVKQLGTHMVHWDASGVASGVYFYRLQAGDFVASKKLLLLK